MTAPRWLAIHGFAGGPRSWRGVATALDGALELDCWTVAGHGREPVWPAAGRDAFDAEVSRLEAAAEAVARDSGRPPRVVGYSLGGRLALGLLARGRVEVGGAMLIGAHPGLRSAAERAERRQADEEWARRIEEEGLVAFERRWSRLPLFASQVALDPALLAAQREVRLGHEPGALAAAMRAFSLGSMPSRWPALASLRVPVWLVSGALDEKFGALQREMGSALPAATEVRIPGAGHNPLLEAPDAVAALLLEAESLLQKAPP